MLKYTMQNIRQNGSESPLIFTRTVIEPANNISSQPNSSAFLRLLPFMLNIFMICRLLLTCQKLDGLQAVLKTTTCFKGIVQRIIM